MGNKLLDLKGVKGLQGWMLEEMPNELQVKVFPTLSSCSRTGSQRNRPTPSYFAFDLTFQKLVAELLLVETVLEAGSQEF